MTDAPEMAVWSKEDGMESAGAITPCKGPPEYIRLDTHEAVVAENKRLRGLLKKLDGYLTRLQTPGSEPLNSVNACGTKKGRAQYTAIVRNEAREYWAEVGNTLAALENKG